MRNWALFKCRRQKYSPKLPPGMPVKRILSDIGNYTMQQNCISSSRSICVRVTRENCVLIYFRETLCDPGNKGLWHLFFIFKLFPKYSRPRYVPQVSLFFPSYYISCSFFLANNISMWHLLNWARVHHNTSCINSSWACVSQGGFSNIATTLLAQESVYQTLLRDLEMT